MILYIPINQNVEIISHDLLKSPKGNNYQVISQIENDIFKLHPLDVLDPLEKNMEFSISKTSLIERGWKKRRF